MSRLLAILLAVTASMLAWAAYEQRGTVVLPSAPVTATPGAEPQEEVDVPAAEAPPMPPLRALTETVARPLFIAGRRPPTEEPKPAAPTVAAAPSSPPKVKLNGVFIVDDRPVALLRAAAGTRRASVGDTVDGWRVKAILPDRVRFSRGKTEHVVELRTFEPAPAPRQARRTRSRERDPDDELPPDEELIPDEEGEDPAAATRPRRPRLGPREAARQRLQQRREAAGE